MLNTPGAQPYQGARDDGLGFICGGACIGALVAAGAKMYVSHKAAGAASDSAEALEASSVANAEAMTEVERQRVASELLALDAQQRQTRGIVWLSAAAGLLALAVLT